MFAPQVSDGLPASTDGLRPTAAKPRVVVLLCIALTLIVVVPYLNSLQNGFVWLDHSFIVEGMVIVRSPAQFLEIFSNDRGYGGYHRPLYNLIYSIDHFFWGKAAAGYHLSSLAFHVANCLLLFLCMRRLTGCLKKSFAVAAIWGLLPVNTSVVSLIASKGDLLATFFTLGCLLAWVTSRKLLTGRVALARSMIIGALFILAILAKESALVFPAFAVYLLWANDSNKLPASSTRFHILGIASLVGITLLYVVYRLSIGSVQAPLGALSITDRMLTFIPVYANYMVKSLPGVELSMNDSVTIWRYDSAFVMHTAVAVVLIVAQAFIALKIPSTRAGIVWLNLFLLPVSHILPIQHFRADRFLYLPAIGAVWAFVSVASAISRAAPIRRYAGAMLYVGLLTALLCWFGYRVRDRNVDFQTDRTMFEPVVQAYPTCREAHSALAGEYVLSGEDAKAQDAFEAALSTNPQVVSYVDREGTMANYGVFLVRSEQFARAYDIFRDLRAQSGRTDPEADFLQAVCAIRLRRYPEAKMLLGGFLQRQPGNADALFLLGQVLHILGEHRDALSALSAFVQTQPNARDMQLAEKIMSQIKLAQLAAHENSDAENVERPARSDY